MKLSKLIPAACLVSVGLASGQGLYSIMPDDDDPEEGLPLHWTVALNVGYDDNPSPVLSDCPGFDSDGALYVSGSIQGNVLLKSSQTAIEAWAKLGVTYYIDEVQQTSPTGTSLGSSDDTFYTTQGGVNITHHVNERLRIRSRSNVSYEMEPDYDAGLSTDRRQGQYFSYSSDTSLGYSWTERLGTVTGYRLSGTIWDDVSNSDNVSHLIYNQFRYRTSESTVLTGSIRHGFQDNDGGNTDSLYLLVGAEHQFSPTTVGVIRVGAQQYSPDGGSDSWSPYVEGTINTQVNEQLGLQSFIYYGNEGRNRRVWTHDCSAIDSAPDTTSLVLFNDRKILRIGAKATYEVSEMLTIFGGTNLVMESYEDGVYVNNTAGWNPGDSASGLDESLVNINIGGSLQIKEAVYVTVSLNYTDSSSDADIRDYDRSRVQLGVRASF